jgi:hypothetical protein
MEFANGWRRRRTRRSNGTGSARQGRPEKGGLFHAPRNDRSVQAAKREAAKKKAEHKARP